MSLGLGIFLSTVVISMLLLYRWTRENWNWSKIARRTLITLGVVVVGGVLLLLGGIGYEKWQQRAQIITSFKGITVGEKLTDVIFKHGSFEKEEKIVVAVGKYQDEEDYLQKDKRLNISVRGGLITRVIYICDKESDYTSLNGISCNDSGDTIKELFQSKVRVLCSKQTYEGAQFKRVFDVGEYGTRYLVRQNKVEGFFVTDSKELTSLVGLDWDFCK